MHFRGRGTVMADLRFIETVDGIHADDGSGERLGEITFEDLGNGIYNINHTWVSDRLRGQGVAGQLVERAVDRIHEKGGTVMATCSYAKGWLERHPDKA